LREIIFKDEVLVVIV